MSRITENVIEDFAIELLGKSGYEYIYAPSIAPDSDTPGRDSFEDYIYKAKWGMKEHIKLLKEGDLPIPPKSKNPRIVIRNEDEVVVA